MTKIMISLYALTVEVECDANHPDALSDASNRATELFTHALSVAVQNKVDPMRIAIEEIEEED
jgi:hypothetical protein